MPTAYHSARRSMNKNWFLHIHASYTLAVHRNIESLEDRNVST